MRYPFRSQIAAALSAIGIRWKFDAHYFAKNSFLVLLGQGVGFLRGIVSGYLVARFFEQETYGQYQFMLSIMGMLAVFSIPGMATPVARAWSKNEPFSIDAITRHQVMVGSIGSLLLLGAIPFLGLYGKADLWPLFVAAAIIFPVPSIAMVRFGSYTVGKARFDIALRANVAWSLISIVCTTSIILFNQSALLMLVVATLAPPIVYLWMGRNFTPTASKDPEDSAKIVRFAWRLTFASLPADLTWYLDKLMISHFFGLNQLALFSVALIIPEQVKIFTKQFFPVAFSKQASIVDSRESRRKLTQAVLAGTAVFSVGAVAYALVSPVLMALLFPQYDTAQLSLLTSVAAISVVTNPASLFGQYLEAQGMIRETRIAQWSAAGFFAVALVTLIPAFGLLGAVLARGVFRIAFVGLSAWFVHRAPYKAS